MTVTTGINQSFLNGEATLKIGGQISGVTGKQSLKSPSWILHDNLGYIFPEGGNLALQAKKTEGSWNWVARRYPDERMEAQVFKMWFDHGKNPAGVSYQYILVPGADKEQLESLDKNLPFEISNGKNIQAVISKDETLAGIVFYRAGKLDGDFGIEVNSPCIMMIRKKSEGMQVSIADPTQLETEIQITLAGEFTHDNAKVEDGKTNITVSLPHAEEAGKTITLELKQN